MLQTTRNRRTERERNQLSQRFIKRNVVQQRKFTSAKQVQNLYATSKLLFLELVKEIPFKKHSFPLTENQRQKVIIMILNFIEANNLKFEFSNYKLKQLKKDSNLFLGTLIDFLNKSNITIKLDIDNKGTAQSSFSKEEFPDNTVLYCLSTAWLKYMPEPLKKGYAKILNDNLFMSNAREVFEYFDKDFFCDYYETTEEKVEEENAVFDNTLEEIEKLANKFSLEELKKYNPKNRNEEEVKKALIEFDVNLIDSLYDGGNEDQSILDEGGVYLAQMYFVYVEENMFGEFMYEHTNNKAMEIGIAYPVSTLKYKTIEDNFPFQRDNSFSIENVNLLNSSLSKVCSSIYNAYKNV